MTPAVRWLVAGGLGPFGRHRPEASIYGGQAADSNSPAVGLVGAIAVSQNLWEPGMLLVLIGTISFLAGWFTLGVAAIRLDRTSSALRPA